jgi:NADPH2:quinone reductase
MKAVGYYEDGKLVDVEVPAPEKGPTDLLVEVKAVSVNPVDYKVRRSRKAEGGRPVILGWDAAGVVREVGAGVTGFKPGDEVFYAGALLRPGSNAELQAVDFRIVGHKPRKVSFAEAASLPLTSLTAWEGLFEQLAFPEKGKQKILFIGGAGGVGSIGIQLVKTLTDGKVYATSGREDSRRWLEQLGVDGIVDRKRPLAESAKALGIEGFDAVFSTTHTNEYFAQLADVVRPFGSIVAIDEPGALPFDLLKPRSLKFAWELMFTKSLFGYRMETQGKILDRIAALVDEGKLRTTANVVHEGLRAEVFRTAHAVLEDHTAVGKIVVRYA